MVEKCTILLIPFRFEMQRRNKLSTVTIVDLGSKSVKKVKKRLKDVKRGSRKK